jgi:hypothetical protein
MSNGNGNGIKLPDLEKPPAVIEGPGGGPAFPTGGGLSKDEKDAFAEVSDICQSASNFSAVVSIIFFLAGPEAWLLADGSAIASGVFWIDAQLFSALAADPPRPYRRIVTIEPRRCPVPKTRDPIVRSLGIATQQQVFTIVTAQCYLDALERLGGAQKARDLSWAVTHYGVVVQCRRTILVNVATSAAALYAVAQSLQGSRYDLTLKKGSGGVRNWINSAGVQRAMAQRLKHAGLTAGEVQAVIKWWKTDPTYQGPTSKLSAQLAQTARKLYRAALRMNK